MLMNFCFTQPTKSVHIAKVIINEKTRVFFLKIENRPRFALRRSLKCRAEYATKIS